MEKTSLLSGEDKASGTFLFLLLDIVKLEPGGLWATELTHPGFVVIRNDPNTVSCQDLWTEITTESFWIFTEKWNSMAEDSTEMRE